MMKWLGIISGYGATVGSIYVYASHIPPPPPMMPIVAQAVYYGVPVLAFIGATILHITPAPAVKDEKPE